MASRHHVSARHELRFETSRKCIDAEDGAARVNVLRVVGGTCEVAGCELFPGHTYPLVAGRSYGVFTWFGCEVELHETFCTGVYTSEETPMTQIAKVHGNLEAWRDDVARGAAPQGPPRIAIVGSSNSGKSTLARTLGAYAVRCGRKPIMVDLDVSKNSVAIPGTVAATVLERRSDLFEETGALDFSARQPLAYFVGADKVSDNSKRLREQTKLLAEDVEARMVADPTSQCSGIIIDSFSWSASPSVHNTLVAALQHLKVNVILIIGHDRLLSEMKRVFKDIHVVKVARSGGVVEADANTLTRLAADRMRWYFEGSRGQLSPVPRKLKLGEDIKIFLARANVIADSSIRPIGMDASKDDKHVPQLTVLDVSLKSSVLAFVYATDEAEVLNGSVAGFARVVDVHPDEESVTIETPCPGDLPTKFLVHGKLKWFETA